MMSQCLRALLLSGAILVAGAVRADEQPPPKPPRYTSAGWRELCEAVTRDANEDSANKKVQEFIECSPAELRRELLRKLTEDPREAVAKTACEVLAQTGANEEDARFFWKVHDRCKKMFWRTQVLKCIGLTGDVDSVARLCEIAATPWTDDVMKAGLFVWEEHIVAAQTSIYLLTGQARCFVSVVDRAKDPLRKEVFGDIAKKAADLKEVDKEERSRKLLEEFMTNGLAGPFRSVAQYGLLRLAGRFPIPPSYLFREGIEVDDKRWQRYRTAWKQWWDDYREDATFDKEGGHYVTPTPSPPGIVYFILGVYPGWPP